MLTRLKVSGFKNLVDVDVRFGPFTCIAGGNGVGKSNLFDAIKFLSNLATMSLKDAALKIRGEQSKNRDIRNIFYRAGDTYTSEMSFEAEMIIPNLELNSPSVQELNSSTVTVYRYQLCLVYLEENDLILDSPLIIKYEELCMIGKKDTNFRFPVNHDPQWKKDTIMFSDGNINVFRYSIDEEGRRLLKTSASGDNTLELEFNPSETFLKSNSVRFDQSQWDDILIRRNIVTYPNGWVWREMKSWQNFHFEPSALRKPSQFRDPGSLKSDGEYLPKTLYSIAHRAEHPENILCEISNKLIGVIDGARAVEIDRDKVEEWLTLALRYKDGTKLPAHQLSDGTLRLLALAVLELDSKATGVYCIEEPENGFHPEHIPRVIEQLQDIAVDPQFPVEEYNPLRQVIINTHSPAVVRLVPDDSLLIAERTKARVNGKICDAVEFNFLDDTWRAAIDTGDVEEPVRPVYKGELVPYLNPTPISEHDQTGHDDSDDEYIEPRRVIDREDLHQYIPGYSNN